MSEDTEFADGYEMAQKHYIPLVTEFENRVAELEGENKNLKLMVEVLRKALKESPNG